MAQPELPIVLLVVFIVADVVSHVFSPFRSYRHYHRPLICPECRDEVSVDFVRGIEALPVDFKLSKLVDLFQFMKVRLLSWVASGQG